MAVEIITRQDLEQFQVQLLSEFHRLLTQHVQPPRKWLRSTEVRKLLSISHGTLQNMRVNGSLPYSKIDGIFYYPQEEILNLLEKNRH